MKLINIVVLAAMLSLVAGQRGPGSGPWQFATPESQGLSTAELQAAEAAVNEQVDGRVCYVVVKNGFIVYENYRQGWNVNDTRQGWSTTKSHCSSLYGIATQQGWADPQDLVADRNNDTRDCNSNARFEHVLTMTGESTNLNNPTFDYDTDGTNCLDTLSEFVEGNNPEGLSAFQFKNRYWETVLGMENWNWEEYVGYLHCGYTSVTSCRDLARAAQLWVNEGAWPNAGQVISRDHILDGRTPIFPDSGSDYGYTVWLRPDDPVDPEVHSFMGAYSQCAHISKEHEAIVVSMGDGDATGARCYFAWLESRDAIVSGDKRADLPPPLTTEQRLAEIKNMPPAVSVQELLAARDYVASNKEKFTRHELTTFNDLLIEFGKKPLF